jgi:hypothetical protein
LVADIIPRTKGRTVLGLVSSDSVTIAGSWLSKPHASLGSSIQTESEMSVRFWHLADVPTYQKNVRYWGKSGHDADIAG